MHKSPGQNSASDHLYPALVPFDQRMIEVSGGHRIYVEQCGNPKGLPVVVLHGGPGGGCSPAMRRFFDPAVYRVVLFDQRGCGRSKPSASVENNTTWDLVADIEQIRETFGIDAWLVFGGSWGATLSLVYAQAHPDRCKALILRGVFLATEPELQWFYGGGAGRFWPDQWAKFTSMIPKDEQGDLIAAYHKRLFSGNEDEERRFGQVWATWESALAVLEPGENRGGSPSNYARTFSRLENHYFTHRAFLSEDQAILRNLDKLSEITGVIVQGRYDMVCPPESAFRLAEGWPNARLRMIPAAGHALSEPGITKALIETTDRFRTLAKA